MVSAAIAAGIAANAIHAAGPAGALPPVMRAVLQWGPGDLLSVQAATAAKANFVHTFPRPPKMRGLIPVVLEKEWLGKWSDQVAALHRAGMFVSASVGSTCFNPEVFRQAGLDPEAFFARDEDGRPSSMLGGSYGKELMSSCYANPRWIGMLAENVLGFARAGFDGIWYDVGGYVDNAVLYCHCEHCQRNWREHLVRLRRNPAVPLPARTHVPDYTQWVDREFLRWRWQRWIAWEARVREIVRAEYPRFAFSHNMGVKEGTDRGMHMFLQSTTNLFDYVHWEEWGHGTAPYSDIPSYLLGRAAGAGKPVMLVQNDKPPRNPLQHQIYLAEGYACGGVPEFGAVRAAASRAFLEFVERNEDLYRPGRSLANVAVVYSCWSQAFHASPAKRWPAQWMGQLLLDRHVPFDYLVAERDLGPATLANYRTLILPDQACLTEAQIAAVRSFLNEGGNVITTGTTAAFDGEMTPRRQSVAELFSGRPVADAARVSVGRGRLACFPDLPEQTQWRRNPRDFAKSEKLPPPSPLPADVAATFAWVFGDSLPLQIEAAPTTVVIPRRLENRILLHLVNTNVFPAGKELHPDRDLRITLRLPDGARTSKVELASPDFEGRTPIRDVAVDGHVLRFTVDELRLHDVVIVELEK